jgi:hypothetical protein
MLPIINNLYLIKFDERNLAIIKGNEPKDKKRGYTNRILSYHGSIQSAFKSVLDLQIRGGASGVEAKEILQAIDLLNKRLDELEYPQIIHFLKGANNE